MTIAYQCDDLGYLLYTFTPQVDVKLTQANCGTTHYILPKNATLKTPLEDLEFKICRLSDGEWKYEHDFRGCTVYQGDDSMVISTIGDIPNGWSLEPELQLQLRMKRDAAKKRIKRKLDNLTVTVDGYIFDANPQSLIMMSTMIHSHELDNQFQVAGWVMADNQYVKNLSIGTLKCALILGGSAVGEIYKEYEFL